VPLNTRFKGGEAEDILRRARVRLLFSPSDFLGHDYGTLISGEALPDLAETIAIDTAWDAFVARGKGPLDPAVDAALARLSPDDICDIIFTSGTTGCGSADSSAPERSRSSGRRPGRTRR